MISNVCIYVSPQNYYTDTTFVCNKLGEESVG